MNIPKFSKCFLLFMFFFSSLCAATPSLKQPIIDFYDKEALVYDEGYATPLCKAEDKIVMSIIEPMVVNKKVLDIGCGTGMILNYFQIEEYVGIDISPKMIDVAIEKFPDNFFIAGDMEQFVTTVPSNSFDSIISLYGPLSYAINPVDLLNEFYRILAPGGTLVIMPYTKRVEHKFMIGGYNTASQDGVKRTYYTSKMAQDLMAQTEFTDVEIRGMNYFGNVIWAMDTLYDNETPMEYHYQLLMKEQEFAAIVLPIEYARHSIVIAKKPIQ